MLSSLTERECEYGIDCFAALPKVAAVWDDGEKEPRRCRVRNDDSFGDEPRIRCGLRER